MPFQPFLCHHIYAEICSLGLLFRNAVGLKSLRLITFWSPPSEEVEKQIKWTDITKLLLLKNQLLLLTNWALL